MMDADAGADEQVALQFGNDRFGQQGPPVGR